MEGDICSWIYVDLETQKLLGNPYIASRLIAERLDKALGTKNHVWADTTVIDRLYKLIFYPVAEWAIAWRLSRVPLNSRKDVLVELLTKEFPHGIFIALDMPDSWDTKTPVNYIRETNIVRITALPGQEIIMDLPMHWPRG